LLSSNPSLYGYVKDTNIWTDHYGLNCEAEDFTKEGGATEDDFISEHAKKHRYDKDKKSTKNRSQFGKDMDVKRLRDDTMSNPDSVEVKRDKDGKPYATVYKKKYDFNISTSDTETGDHRVYVNHDDPNRSSQFPYVPRT